MTGDSDGPEEGGSLAPRIAVDIDRDALGDPAPGGGWSWLVVPIVSFVGLYVLLLATTGPSGDSSPAFALGLLVVWVVVGWMVYGAAESTLARAVALVPGWNLLFMFGYSCLSYFGERRTLSRAREEAEGVESLVAEADGLAEAGEFAEATETYRRARERAEEFQEFVEDEEVPGGRDLAESLETLAKAKTWANGVDAEFDGVVDEIESVERRREGARDLLESGDHDEALSLYEAALAEARDLRETLGSPSGERTIAEVRADDTDATAFERAARRVEELVERLEAGRDEARAAVGRAEFDRQLSDARSAAERGDRLADEGDHAGAVEAYEAAIGAAEAALDAREAADVGGDADEARTLVEDLRRRRGEALLAELGERLGAGPDDPGPDGVEDAVDRAESLLSAVEGATVPDELARERELLAADAARRLVAVAESGVGAVADRAADRFETGEYDRARDEFERGHRVARGVLETLDDRDVDVDVGDLAALADRCDGNADAARRARLGIGDGEPSLRRAGADPGPAREGVGSATGGTGPVTGGVWSVAREADAAVEEVFAGYPLPERVPVAPDLELSFGDVDLGDRIGAGGNADVHRATAETDEGTVELAVKLPRIGGESEDTVEVDRLASFVEEAETWSEIDDHQGIVGVVDWGSENPPWIAMEYMDGGTLGDAAEAMDLPQKFWTAHTVADAVYHAHLRRIHHYDLKPANVLLRSIEGAWAVPKVSDWGLARDLLESSGTVEGYSPAYAAPEQLDPDAYGGQNEHTDTYQLGAVLYELFAGRPPFEGSTGAVVAAHLDDDPDPPSAHADLPAELDDLLLGALAKHPDDRPDPNYLRDGLLTVADGVV